MDMLFWWIADALNQKESRGCVLSMCIMALFVLAASALIMWFTGGFSAK